MQYETLNVATLLHQVPLTAIWFAPTIPCRLTLHQRLHAADHLYPLYLHAAIALWTATGDEDHVWIVGSYFHYSVPGGFTEPVCKDITPGKQPKAGLFSKSFQSSDPMYVVYASKQA